jgi:hypothetical protein
MRYSSRLSPCVRWLAISTLVLTVLNLLVVLCCFAVVQQGMLKTTSPAAELLDLRSILASDLVISLVLTTAALALSVFSRALTDSLTQVHHTALAG